MFLTFHRPNNELLMEIIISCSPTDLEIIQPQNIYHRGESPVEKKASHFSLQGCYIAFFFFNHTGVSKLSICKLGFNTSSLWLHFIFIFFKSVDSTPATNRDVVSVGKPKGQIQRKEMSPKKQTSLRLAHRVPHLLPKSPDRPFSNR